MSASIAGSAGLHVVALLEAVAEHVLVDGGDDVELVGEADRSDATACSDWSKWRTLFGPIGGIVGDVEDPRVALAATRAMRSAISVSAARQSVGHRLVGGTTTSPITASTTSVSSSSFVRT